jgi:GPH family glycoside/pentoside/hexuronide:cation symporter
LSEAQTVLRILLPFFVSILASIVLWVWISRRYGKKIPAFWGILGLGSLVSLAYPVLPPGMISPALGVAILGGLLSGSIILFESLVADVVDVDELQSGRNREGLYFGMWKMATKLSRALGLLLAGVLLHAIGFDAGADAQSPEVVQRLSWIFGPGVGGLLVLGGLVFLRFPLGDAQHRRVQRLLKRRRASVGQ